MVFKCNICDKTKDNKQFKAKHKDGLICNYCFRTVLNGEYRQRKTKLERMYIKNGA